MGSFFALTVATALRLVTVLCSSYRHASYKLTLHLSGESAPTHAASTLPSYSIILIVITTRFSS